MRALKGLLGAVLLALVVLAGGPVASALATVTLESSPEKASSNTTPTFSGITDELAAPITVTIYEGEGTEGKVVQTPTAEAPLLSTSWSLTASPPLEEGTYTATVEQPELLGGTSTAGPVTFKIITAAPKVTLTGPPSLSNKTKPIFSGEAGDPNEPVVVHIHNTETGTDSTAEAGPSGGSWSANNEPELEEGSYTAYATQESSYSNGPGHSETVAFTIVTAKPTVTLTGPETPSNKTHPTFSGTASDPKEQVVVHIHDKDTGENHTATATSGGGAYSTNDEPELEAGHYTAVATQKSSLHNPEGESGTVEFTISTASPTVTLTGPSKLSKNTQPTFSGTASDPTEQVVVHIFDESNNEVTATAFSGGGGWSTNNEPELGEGSYRAYATQASSLSNAPGKSNEVHFTISTAPPTVTITSAPSGVSNKPKPSFGGKASDPNEPVVVHIIDESSNEVTATTSPSGGSWSTSSEPELGEGNYRAYATQASSLGNAAGVSGEVHFTVITSPPTVTLEQPPSPSKTTRPSFTGTASDHTQVTVRIRDSHGNEVAKATASGTGGSWTSGQADQSLESGEYTAVASQESSLGNGTGHSGTVSFTVNTKPPTVSLHQPSALSNDTTPSFTGFASDKTPVTVKIYKGSGTEGEPFSTATAEGTGSGWTSGEASPSLPSGQYTAIAVQPSSLGNEEGRSETVSFRVETGPPQVTLKQPPTPSNHTTPSFTGTASDHTPVVVDIYAGSSATGPIVSEATATGNGGGWTSGAANKALTTGEYTAVATQESSLLGNPTGSSTPVSFFVDTRSPSVTISQPSPLSNNANPTFTGAASDPSKPVVVHIFNSLNAPVTTVTTTPSGGNWSTNGEGTLGSESYTAYATQESSLGNPAGESAHVAFTINTKAPTVTLNSSSVALRSNNTTPSFSGTGSDVTTLTIRVFEGSKPEGHEVTSTTAAGTGGAWASAALAQALAGAPGAHTYTVIAEQPSSLGNPTGKSNAVTFVVDTSAPTVTFAQPTTPSNNTAPSFSGTASESTPVTIRVYEEPKENEKVKVTEVKASVSAGTWVTAPVALATGTHKYAAIASQPSEIGNSSGETAPVKFTVDTTSPKVTLNVLAKPTSNNTLPTFSGTASDTTPVTVSVYEGEKAEGIALATATATVTAGSWTSGLPTPALPAGNRNYTAVATQTSSVGNPAGKSSTIKFVVDTTSPTVTMASPASPSNIITPTFTGTAGGTHVATEVTVRVYLVVGGVRGGEVSSAKAAVSGGKWTAGPISPALATGTNTYTAVATYESLLGNLPATAEATFVVNTLPPAVTLIGPPTPSNNRTPAFEGTASDTTPVTLRVYEGKKAEGKEVTSVTATPELGAWKAQATLPLIKRTYTAIALQKSSIGNPEGKSGPVTFIVDPAAPTVVLNPPATWSNNPTPSFSGSASDNSPVTIRIFPGTKPEGPAVASEATAAGTNGAWSSGPASPALPDGQYTAVASQHNATHFEDVGTSEHFTFRIDTVAPKVTLSSPASGSSSPSTSETASGAAGSEEGDDSHVTAQLFAGPSIAAGQSPVQSITTNVVGNAWSATFGGLAPGAYTLRATQSDAAGNVGASSTSTFTVTSSTPAAPVAPSAPATSFSWFPPNPRAGESISLVSTSTDASSPITAFAWDLAGIGSFSPGGATNSVTFPTAGAHIVQLRATGANGLSGLAREAIPVGAPALPLLQPFPIVRITSTGTRSGIKLIQLSVLASRGARIAVQCRGSHCPLKRQSHIASTGRRRSAFVEFKGFERSLRAGVILEIRVSKPGATGKYVRFLVRRGKVPVRSDACLDGVAVKPVTCPSS
ncbi:MAG TPA: Ig-like domain-containing protein [Solirubrobacteraceae bacterium]|jgi:hypothetical protein